MNGGHTCAVCGTGHTSRWNDARAPGAEGAAPAFVKVCDSCHRRIKDKEIEVPRALPKARKDADPNLVVKLPWMTAKPPAAAAAGTGGTAAHTADMIECGRILQQLKIHPRAFYFKAPVVELYPDMAESYLQTVRYPMDLGTVEVKLDTNKYKTHADFQTDILLIFSNCDQYNRDACEVKLAAKALRQKFQRAIKKSFPPANTGGAFSWDEYLPKELDLEPAGPRKRKANTLLASDDYHTYTDDPAYHGTEGEDAEWRRPPKEPRPEPLHYRAPSTHRPPSSSTPRPAKQPKPRYEGPTAPMPGVEPVPPPQRTRSPDRVTPEEKTKIEEAMSMLNEEQAAEVYSKVLRFDRSAPAPDGRVVGEQEVEVDMEMLTSRTWVKLREFLGIERTVRDHAYYQQQPRKKHKKKKHKEGAGGLPRTGPSASSGGRPELAGAAAASSDSSSSDGSSSSDSEEEYDATAHHQIDNAFASFQQMPQQ